MTLTPGYVCAACGARSACWTGRCGACAAWNTVAPEPSHPVGCSARPRRRVPAEASPPGWSGARDVRDAAPTVQPLADVDPSQAAAHPTGLPELDAVLGGGLVPGSVTLVGGEPGVGKSTLLLQVLRSVAAAGQAAVLLSAEESARQVRLRAERLGPVPRHLFVVPTTDIGELEDAVRHARPSLIVVDSVQTVADGAVAGPPGSVAQVRACAERCVALAKTEDIAVVLVGHVTKDGSLAGPRVLEHVVDTVVTVEGDRHHALRLVRTVKHRFGPTGALGLFEMGDGGLQAVRDPFRYLLGDRRPDSAGSAVALAMDGQRALPVEVQALTVPAVPGVPPRRSAQGVDGGRLAQLLAVLGQHGPVSLAAADVFVSVVGGVRTNEPAADLAVAVAVGSSALRRPVPADLAIFGEVGLGGEVRRSPATVRRLAAAAAAGFGRVLAPPGTPADAGIPAVCVDTVADAFRVVFGSTAARPAGRR